MIVQTKEPGTVYESDRLAIREISWDDTESIHRLHSFPEVDEFNTLGVPKDLEETKEYLAPLVQAQQSEPRKVYFWKVLLKPSDEFIGIAGYSLSADKFNRGEIYYKLLPSHWGKGYATELGRGLIDLGFNHFRLHRVEAGVATENTRSINVLEKIGMTREGLHRKVLPIRGKWVDNFHYAIVEGDQKNMTEDKRNLTR